MAKYDKMTSLKNPGRPIQVESAIRDGNGKNIPETYSKKLYQHCLDIYLDTDDGNPANINLFIINNSNIPFTNESLKSYVNSLPRQTPLNANGYFENANGEWIVMFDFKSLNDTQGRTIMTFCYIGDESGLNITNMQIRDVVIPL